MPAALAARFGAPAALVAAICFAAFDLPHFALGTSVRASADSPLFAFHAIAGLAGLVALVLVIFALHGWIDDQKGARAPLGFGLALAGTVLAAGGAWGEAFMVPAVRESAAGAIERPEGMLIVGLLLTVTVFATGWVLLTLALRRAGLLSTRAAVVVVGVGAMASAMPLPGGVLLFIPGVLLLRSASRRPGRRCPRLARGRRRGKDGRMTPDRPRPRPRRARRRCDRPGNAARAPPGADARWRSPCSVTVRRPRTRAGRVHGYAAPHRGPA